jgi:hypothetical protein
VMRVVALVPWPMFLACFMLANALAFWWLSAPLPWRWRVPVLAACWPALLLGNINPLLCVCLVLALTGSGAWSVVPSALTKITPAFMPVVWWLVHREWRRVTEAGLLTLIMIAATYAQDPGLWSEWLGFLLHHADDSPLRLVRLVVAAGLAVWAVRTRRLWVAGLAFYLLLPMTDWHVQALSGLMVLPRLVRWGRRSAPRTATAPEHVAMQAP